MPDYKLLTPGPLTTTDTVKREMLFDHCTWEDDYKKITQKIITMISPVESIMRTSAAWRTA